MSIEAVIFHVPDTLIRDNDRPFPGSRECLEQLVHLGLQTVALGDRPRADLKRQLDRAGLAGHVDHIIGAENVCSADESTAWIRPILETTGLGARHLLTVGASCGDARAPLQGHVIYAHAAWVRPWQGVGLCATTPAWVAAAVKHIFRKRHLWYWTLDTEDRRESLVTIRAVIDAIALLDAGYGHEVGPLSMQEFVMLHLLASLNASDALRNAHLWTSYPSPSGQTNPVIGDFLQVASSLFPESYRADLIQRQRPALRSLDARRRGHLVGALCNQLASVSLNPRYRADLRGRRVLVIDNFITAGPSVETARNILLAAGAARVDVACVGKYGPEAFVFSRPETDWDPISPSPPDAAAFEYDRWRGEVNPAAHDAFVRSHRAMALERW